MSPKLKVLINFLWKKRTLYVLLGMLIAVGIFILILATTLNVYLPGYLDVDKRAFVMESALRIDSLEVENNLRMAYLNNMLDILHDRVKADNLLPYDSTVPRIQDTLLPASEREQAFVAKYENRERFGLNALDQLNPTTPTIVFLAPVRGRIIHYDDDATPTETHIELDGNVTVLAPTEGTVVSVSYLMNIGGYQLVLQHAQDYLTLYSNLTSVMVEPGQKVKSGQVMGHAGNAEDPSDSWMGLSAWHKGEYIDPETIMPIE